MMSVVASCWTFALLLYTTWPTVLVRGQSSPPPAKIFVREFTTAKIPYTYLYPLGLVVHEIKYSYTSPTGQTIHFYSVNEEGKPELGQVNSNRFENRVKYIGGDILKDATLTIERFTKQDGGKFEIEVIGDKQEELKVITTLQAKVLANVTKFITNKDDIKEGDNITLSCMVTQGLPSPRIEILRNNIKIKELLGSNTSDTTLNHNFTRISHNDGGSYICKVTMDGHVSRKSYKIEVKYAPKFTQSPNTQLGCIGKMINLNCNADGNPKPTVHVVLPDGKISNKLNIELKTFGVYRCEAKNNLGNESRNIKVSQETAKPAIPSFNDCKFNKLTWEHVSDGVNLKLQFKEKNSEGPWKDVKTTLETSYNPSTNDSFSDKKDYEFRLFAENCVGNVVSEICSVKGNSPSSGAQSSSNAGVIAGSVIAVMVVLLIVVIVLVVLKKRGYFGGTRKNEESKPMYDLPNSSTPQETRSHKSGETMRYSDLVHDDNEPRPTPPPSAEPTNYAEIAHPDNSNGPTYTNNIPSWV